MTKRLVLWALGWYRHYRGLRPDACRFDPTCSAYAAEAVERHGVIKGGLLALRRVSRCHPFGGSGYDPVPPVPGHSPTPAQVPVGQSAVGSAGGPAGRSLGRQASRHGGRRPQPLLLKRQHHA